LLTQHVEYDDDDDDDDDDDPNMDLNVKHLHNWRYGPI